MAFIATGVNHQISHHGMAGKWLDTETASFLHKVANHGAVCKRDATVNARTGGWRSDLTASSEGKAAVNLSLHGEQHILNRGVSWDSTSQGVPTGFGGFRTVAEDLQGDVDVLSNDDTWGEIAFDDVVVITRSVGLHFFKKFNLQGSRFVNASQARECFLNPQFPRRFKVHITFLNGEGFLAAEAASFWFQS